MGRVKALGRAKDKSPSTLRCVQAQKKAHRWKYITLNVGGDVARFACEYLHQM